MIAVPTECCRAVEGHENGHDNLESVFLVAHTAKTTKAITYGRAPVASLVQLISSVLYASQGKTVSNTTTTCEYIVANKTHT